MVEPDLGQEPLEPGATCGRLPTAALVFVDDDDAVRRPAECQGTAAEVVLQPSRLAMFEHLLGTGLADVDDRQSVEMPGLDLALLPRWSADRVIVPRIAWAS